MVPHLRVCENNNLFRVFFKSWELNVERVWWLTKQGPHTWNVRKEGYIPHGKLQTFTCGGLQSIGTLCPQVYASWKFFLCGHPQYFHMQVRSCPQRGLRKSTDVCGHQCGHLRTSLRTSMRTSAWIGADVRMDWCGRPHGLMRMSAWMGADVCGSPHGWVRTSAGPEDLLELLPLLCNNLLIICGITWSYAVWLSF